MSYRNPVRVELHQTYSSYTNLDEISGQVVLTLVNQETIAAITVKLEGESRTRLAGIGGPPGSFDPYARNQTQLEVHKLLYKVITVFPTVDIASANQRSQYSLPPGQYTYPFKFKIPFNNDCLNNNSLLNNLSQMRMDMVQGPNAHVKTTLPPTLGGHPGEAEIQYFVKATVQRPAFYKENFRHAKNFLFFPIEPPRPPPNRRESFARVQHQFAPPVNVPEKTGLFRRSSSVNVDTGATPPSISVEGRLPDPAILTCNEALPLRILVNRLNESPATLHLEMLHIELLAFTTIRAQQLRRNEVTNWTIMSTSNLHREIMEENGNKFIELPSSLWKQRPLPNTVTPTFSTCNIVQSFGLNIKVGLSWSLAGKSYPEMHVLVMRMPCQVYSGIAPPPALLEAMANRPPATDSGNVDAATSIHPPAQASTFHGRPTQTTDHIEPSPDDIPPDAPPSYEDAIADGMPPIIGPRSDFQQQQPTTPTVGEKGRPRLFDDAPP